MSGSDDQMMRVLPGRLSSEPILSTNPVNAGYRTFTLTGSGEWVDRVTGRKEGTLGGACGRCRA
jgi:hypothetical protein